MKSGVEIRQPIEYRYRNLIHIERSAMFYKMA